MSKKKEKYIISTESNGTRRRWCTAFWFFLNYKPKPGQWCPHSLAAVERHLRAYVNQSDGDMLMTVGRDGVEYFGIIMTGKV